MLSPVSYQNDMNRLFGRVVNHNCLKINRNTFNAITQSFQSWNKLWPDEPFDPKESSFDPNFESRFEYDIASAVQRQKLFYYQVSLPHYRDQKFLEKGLRRYKMYLYLKRMYKEEFLIPCYDIDIFWHTHQVKPTEYGRDTKAIVGYLLPHDDSVNDRSPGSKLCNSEEITVKLWGETYGAFYPFQSSGAMFRGESPKGKLWEASSDIQKDLLKGDEFFLSIGTKSCPFQRQHEFNRELCSNYGSIAWRFPDAINLGKYNAKDFTDPENGEICLNMKLKRVTKDVDWDLVSEQVNTFSLTDIVRSSKKPNDAENKNKVQFKMPVSMDGFKNIVFDENICVSIEFNIVQHGKATSCFCWEYDKTRIAGEWKSYLGKEPINPIYFKDSSTMSIKSTISGLTKSGSLVVPVTIEKSSHQPIWKKLSIKPGSFYDCVIPENVESLWGPVPLKRLPDNVDNKCRAVTHE